MDITRREHKIITTRTGVSEIAGVGHKLIPFDVLNYKLYFSESFHKGLEHKKQIVG